MKKIILMVVLLAVSISVCSASTEQLIVKDGIVLYQQVQKDKLVFTIVNNNSHDACLLVSVQNEDGVYHTADWKAQKVRPFQLGQKDKATFATAPLNWDGMYPHIRQVINCS